MACQFIFLAVRTEVDCLTSLIHIYANLISGVQLYNQASMWLMGRVLQSITQLSVSNRWYVLVKKNYTFRPNRGHQVCPK